MKQVKISNYFSKASNMSSAEDENRENVIGKRKRKHCPKDATPEKGSSSSFKKSKTSDEGKRPKGDNIKGDLHRSKGSEFRKVVDVLGAAPIARTAEARTVLSPSKTTENILVDGSLKSTGARRSPNAKKQTSRNLNFDLSNLTFDQSFFDLACEDGKVGVKSGEDAFTFGDGILELNDFDWCSPESDLTFHVPVRCEVLKLKFSNGPKYEQVLLVCAEGSDKKSVCRLRDMWTFLSVKANDKITIKAVEIDGGWVVNAKNGFVVVNPDVMTPITSLVNSMYCLRRGILSSVFKRTDSNGKCMLIGRMVHELLQESLLRKLDTEKEMSEVLDSLLESKSYLREMYQCGLEWQDARRELITFIPRIINLIEMYFKADDPPRDGFRGKITEVMDIEEYVASSKIGIQGRVDLTVKIHTNDKTRTVPLEVKTGRASFAKEHKVQVITYTLLLDEIIRNVQSGLLLYLREGVMKEIKIDSDEIRNLLLLRNEFVKYSEKIKRGDLPEPIRSTSCSGCPQSRVCSIYLRRDGLDELPQNHPIRELNFPDVKQSHVDYFISWTGMIFSEHEASLSSGEFVVDGLFLESEVTTVGEDFRHTFRFGGKELHIRPGSYVTVSSQTRSVIAKGRLLTLKEGCCMVLLNKKLENFTESYRIEFSKSNLLPMYLTNLSYLMDESCCRLRELIIDRIPPSFDEKISKKILNDDCVEILKTLNKQQQRAVLKTAASRDYLLIKGPPGTGKTQTIVALVKFLLLQQQTVLITGHTHSSVDNILLKLKDVDFLRLGSLDSVDERIHSKCYFRLVEECKSTDDVKRLFDARVVASTCLGFDAELLSKKKFDICLMDESSQVLQVEAVKPLMHCRKFILIGDSNQLPPVVKSSEARDSGMSESIFKRLESESATVSLRLQYRMNKAINDLANELTYGGELECGSKAVAEATLNLRERNRFAGLKGWIREILSPEMRRSVVFADTSDYFEDEVRSSKPSTVSNLLEAEIISRLLESLVDVGVGEEDIGVITPFCGQVDLLVSKIGRRRVEVSTVDRYQGRDKKVIFFSCTKQHRGEVVGGESNHLLNDARRLTVAITRAKVKLIIVGDMKSMSCYAPLSRLMACLTDSQVIHLRNGEKDFFWDEF